jgi:hypothetical protein
VFREGAALGSEHPLTPCAERGEGWWIEERSCCTPDLSVSHTFGLPTAPSHRHFPHPNPHTVCALGTVWLWSTTARLTFGSGPVLASSLALLWASLWCRWLICGSPSSVPPSRTSLLAPALAAGPPSTLGSSPVSPSLFSRSTISTQSSILSHSAAVCSPVFSISSHAAHFWFISIRSWAFVGRLLLSWTSVARYTLDCPPTSSITEI